MHGIKDGEVTFMICGKEWASCLNKSLIESSVNYTKASKYWEHKGEALLPTCIDLEEGEESRISDGQPQFKKLEKG